MKCLITVVDNGSSDGTSEAILHRFPDVRLIRLQTNRGFTGGLAEGLALSDARNVVFLNNDAIAEPGCLEALIGAMEAAASDVISVAGKIVDFTGERIDFIGGLLTFDGHALQNGFRKPLQTVAEPEEGSELLFACGGNMIVRREAFLELGGFDSDYFAYLEDVDFGWRAWLSGWRILYAPRATVRHKSSATSDRLGSFERGVLFERNALQTAIKNYEGEVLAQAAGPIFLTLLHRLHRYVVDRNPETAELTREPFGDLARSLPTLERLIPLHTRLRRRLAAAILGRRDLALIEDPLTTMQFRAIEWFLRHQERIVEKRIEVQSRRTRSDREIFERFPIHYVPTYPGDRELMASPLFELLKPRIRSTQKNLEDIIQL